MVSGPGGRRPGVSAGRAASRDAGQGYVVGCSNLVAEGDRYLLVQESKPSAWYRFGLPAGRPEAGETLEEAAAREAFEETGLRVEPTHLVGVYQCPLTSEGVGVVNFVFASPVVGGRLRSSAEHPVVRYFALDEIERLSASRQLRGTHVVLAIAAHRAGIRLPDGIVQTLPESPPPEMPLPGGSPLPESPLPGGSPAPETRGR